MKTWYYIEPTSETDMTPVQIAMTEAEILAQNFKWWSDGLRRIGKAHLISEQHCIDDFVVVHWASETPILETT